MQTNKNHESHKLIYKCEMGRKSFCLCIRLDVLENLLILINNLIRMLCISI